MNKDELKLMIEDNAKASSPYKPSDLVWQRLSSIFQQKLDAEGIRSVESQSFNSSFASYGRNDKRYQRYASHLGGQVVDDPYALACQLFYRQLRQRNPIVTDAVGVSPVSIGSGMSVGVDGKQVTWDFLLSLDVVQTIVRCSPNLATEPCTVVDLGSGWGRVGSVLCQLNPRLTYVACDIPTSLIIAQEYLPQHLPGVKVQPHSETRQLDKITRQTLGSFPGTWFCCPQQLDVFDDGCVDAFINLYSLQEMTMQQNIEYMGIIDRVAKGGLFLTQQRLIGDVMTRENYPYNVAWERLFDSLTLFSPNYFEAAFMI